MEINDTLADLDEIVAAADEADAPAEQAEFAITDDAMAGWAIRKIRQARETHAAYAAECDARIDKLHQSIDAIMARRNTSMAEAARTESFFTGKLAEFFSRAPGGKIKTTKTLRKYKLPEGELVLKSQSPQTTHDDDKLVPWLKANGRAGLIKIEEKSKWAEVKEGLDISVAGACDIETGEIVPGVLVIARPDVFEIKI